MFKSKSKKSLITLLASISAFILLCLGTVFSNFKSISAEAYKSADMPTGSNVIEQIVSFDKDGEPVFDKTRLDNLAKKVGCSDLKDMAAQAVAAEDGVGIYTSSNFGNTVVEFGSYKGKNLTWIPTYVSNATIMLETGEEKKIAILTLWLAGTESTNTVSELETCSFTDGSASTNKTISPSSNNYSTSYIRAALNNGGTYYGSYSGSSAPYLKTYTPKSSYKFQQFTTGAMAGWIVSPSQVAWQRDANRTKNDPKWAGNADGHYTPTGWLNDKVWLPSLYEVYDSLILTENSTATAFAGNGGLWSMGSASSANEKRANSEWGWLRSGHPTNCNNMLGLAASGKVRLDATVSFTKGTVRPAIHLNISMDSCKHSLVKHPAESFCEEEGHEDYWTCSKCNSMFADSDGKKEIKKPEVIAPTGHDFSEEWSSDSSNHWHVCDNGCDKKDSDEEHTWDSGTVTEQPSCTKTGKKLLTCTTCSKTKTEDIPKSEHTYSSEWKYDSNNHWHECSVCHAVQPNSSVAHSGGTADCENKAECSICGQAYGEYGAHTPETIPAVDPDCTTKGKTEGSKCSVCEEVLTAQSEINTLGHDFSITVSGTQPTCQEGGTATMKCSRCDETQTQDSADPVDHVFTNYVSNNNATCTKNGTKTAECDFGCGTTDTIEDEDSVTGHTPGAEATCTTAQTCEVCNTELAAALGHDYQTAEGGVAPTCTEAGSGKLICSRCDEEKEGDSIPALGHDWATEWSKDETNHWHICSRCDELNENTAHTYEWVITKEATIEESGLMENICTVCGDKDGEQEIAKIIDPNGEIDLPVDINVEFKVTQSSTDNDYSDIEKGLKRGYWAQLWYRNEDGTLGDEFTDKINCFLTLKIPTEIIEAIRGGEEINRDKIAAGLKVYYIDGEGAPVEVENFTIAMRDDDSWQIKFNYNEKFRAEVVFAADLDEQPAEPETSGIPWWVWVIVGTGIAVAIILIVVIAIAAKNKKNGGGTPTDNGELFSRLDSQEQKIDELLTRGDDGGFNTPVELDENGNVIFK